MENSQPAASYYGKILAGNYSNELRAKLTKQIASCASFGELQMSVMPYIAAWRTDQSGIWYEFVCDRFLKLLHSTPEKISNTFCNSIIDHRQYHHTHSYPDIKESILKRNELDSQRNQLRQETVNDGIVEAIYKVALPGGQKVWLKDWASITFFVNDHICLSCGYLCDVSLEMSQKDQLNEMNVTVIRDKNLLVEAERLAALGQISAKVYHEIRNPILSIGALARRLLKKNAHQDSPNLLEVVIKEADRLENILDNLFTYTRKNRIKPTITDMVVLTKSVIDLLQSEFNNQNIEIVLAINGDIPAMMIDKEQIHQSLVHILKNCIEAMMGGGILSITIAEQEGIIEISIRDSGDGILPGHTARVTEPFFTTKVYGTGLGLSLAQKSIDMHGGSLTFVQPDVGGTEVKVQLPVALPRS